MESVQNHQSKTRSAALTPNKQSRPSTKTPGQDHPKYPIKNPAHLAQHTFPDFTLFFQLSQSHTFLPTLSTLMPSLFTDACKSPLVHLKHFHITHNFIDLPHVHFSCVPQSFQNLWVGDYTSHITTQSLRPNLIACRVL